MQISTLNGKESLLVPEKKCVNQAAKVLLLQGLLNNLPKRQRKEGNYDVYEKHSKKAKFKVKGKQS